MRSFPLTALLATAAAGSVPAAASAHRMDAVVRAGPAGVRVEVGYDDDTPSEGATVTLATAAGDVVASGTTDAAGVCVLPRPPAGTYTVTANDHAGHAVTAGPFEVPADDAGGAAVATAGRNRWLMTAAGLGLIAAGTLTLRRLARK